MKIEIRLNPIHGQGVFATHPFRRGERIGRYLSRRTTRDGTHVLWVAYEDRVQGYHGYGRLRFLNHSGRPNAEFDGLELYAVRTIRRGEEITIHYGQEWQGVA